MGVPGLPDGETAAAMERMFWMFSLCFRYPSEEVYLRLRENRRLLELIVREASSGPPDLPDLQEMQAEYVRLMVNNYGHVPAPPYASCYLSKEGLLLESTQRELRRIMREAGCEPREDVREPADHIHLLLEFCAETAGALRRGESGLKGCEALYTVVCRYIAPMAEPFSGSIREHARQDLYCDLAVAFRDFIREMLSLLGGEGESIHMCEQEESLCHPCS
ncbi:MAG: molecular chaperone TorD family protein [Desulfohalobiaceae bacterium]|nr:molecular chaperone TorD family protein [Desulfohalobiaceae bacterium]